MTPILAEERTEDRASGPRWRRGVAGAAHGRPRESGVPREEAAPPAPSPRGARRGHDNDSGTGARSGRRRSFGTAESAATPC